MTLDELKNALLLAAKDEEAESISSMDDVDLAKIRGVVLADKKFINFYKDNLVDIQIDLEESGEMTLGYEFLVKDPYLNRWFKRVDYQVIPISMIVKVYISPERTDHTSLNIPFGPRLERNQPYYLSNPHFLHATVGDLTMYEAAAEEEEEVVEPEPEPELGGN